MTQRSGIELLREHIKQILREMGGPKGGLRVARGQRTQQYKIGKTEDDNQELSTFEAEGLFPGSTEAWVEIVPHLFPEFPFEDAFSIKKNTSWFKIGDELRAAFSSMPQIELATWDPHREDWIEIDHGYVAAEHRISRAPRLSELFGKSLMRESKKNSSVPLLNPKIKMSSNYQDMSLEDAHLFLKDFSRSLSALAQTAKPNQLILLPGNSGGYMLNPQNFLDVTTTDGAKLSLKYLSDLADYDDRIASFMFETPDSLTEYGVRLTEPITQDKYEEEL